MNKKKDSFLFFSERLKYLRESQGLTQIELSKQLKMMGINITEDMISAFERGITEPKLNQIASICKFFNATPNFLFGYTQFSSNELIDNSNHDLKMYLAENNISLEDVLKSIKVFENYIKELY